MYSEVRVVESSEVSVKIIKTLFNSIIDSVWRKLRLNKDSETCVVVQLSRNYLKYKMKSNLIVLPDITANDISEDDNMSQFVDDSLPDNVSEHLQKTVFLQVGIVQLKIEEQHGHGVLFIVNHH